MSKPMLIGGMEIFSAISSTKLYLDSAKMQRIFSPKPALARLPRCWPWAHA